MKTAKYFSINDRNVTPEIYTLLFSGAYVEITGNDQWYKIDPFGGEEYSESGWEPYQSEYHDTEKCFKKQIARGYNNCYHDKARMKALCENPCTCAEAVEHFLKWLVEQGVVKDDALFVKLWW